MSLLALMLLQAAAAAPLKSFDLAKLKARDDCPVAQGDQIVVCARRPSSTTDRVNSDAAIADAMPKAEMGLFGSVRGSLHGEREAVGGFPSNRLMVTVTAPF